jgi:hypothetical protein
VPPFASPSRHTQGHCHRPTAFHSLHTSQETGTGPAEEVDAQTDYFAIFASSTLLFWYLYKDLNQLSNLIGFPRSGICGKLLLYYIYLIVFLQKLSAFDLHML